MSNYKGPRPNRCGRPIHFKPKIKVIKRCFYKDLCHEVPCHTHYINHTIYRHKYIPKYTCSKEETCEDVHINRPRC